MCNISSLEIFNKCRGEWSREMGESFPFVLFCYTVFILDICRERTLQRNWLSYSLQEGRKEPGRHRAKDGPHQQNSKGIR